MKSVGPCCDFVTFWESFMWQWREIHHTQDADTPDFIVSKAKHYWKVYGMSGSEAAKTIHKNLEDGKL